MSKILKNTTGSPIAVGDTGVTLPASPATYGVVYAIVNRVNAKKYIGQTVYPLYKRWSQHKKGYTSSLLHKAILKYGENNFRIGVIFSCFSKDDLDEKEMYAIKTLNSLAPMGYNLQTGGSRGLCAESTKEKLRAINLGKTHSDETKKKLSLISIKNRSWEYAHKKPLDAAARKKISDYHKGVPKSKEHRKKISVGNKGKKYTDAQKVKLSISNGGKSFTAYKDGIAVAICFSLSNACSLLQLRDPKTVQRCLKSPHRTYKGYTFKYV